jgi:tRNA (cmo5U34)-methyltransferase
VGCGAGNYTLKLLFQLPDLNCTLLDLSQPMLDRAVERVSTATTGRVVDAQGDVRQFDFQPNSLDLIVAGSVLHHLRSEEEWRAVFAGFHTALRPGGSVWVFDLVESSTAPVGAQMQQRYGEYLVQLKGEDYRDTVFEYIAQEDTPKSLVEQLDLLREVGFAHLEILHKTACFATFGASKEG